MSNPSSRPQASKSGDAAARKRTQSVIGAVAGAVIGGVLGVIAVKKVRDGTVKRMVPAKVPVLAKRAAGVAKTIAHDAKIVAKATALNAADAAMQQVTTAATQFVVDVASGQTPKPPAPPSPASAGPNVPPVTAGAVSAAAEKPTAQDEAPHRRPASPKATSRKKSTSPKKSVSTKPANQRKNRRDQPS